MIRKFQFVAKTRNEIILLVTLDKKKFHEGEMIKDSKAHCSNKKKDIHLKSTFIGYILYKTVSRIKC